MRIIAFATLRDFFEDHADSESALRQWYADASRAVWRSPNDIKQYAASASILSGNRVCFNLRGNTYRLIVLVNYAKGKIYLKWIGTHAEYDKINAETVAFAGD